ncbi:hypothetical protein T265_00024 [Opisthorchis viverrini]|uniref:Uncharacterized protein n=1 Tax=Opisthorchis viverrini TaxID=6198 RepID=A0A075AJX7_OPIVI|nr:hypothetical protein T265_00024 [Opisthorchis viverrini]KER34154.1 hypothetical protein T265_00024 [Opisthorchis viverrini]
MHAIPTSTAVSVAFCSKLVAVEHVTETDPNTAQRNETGYAVLCDIWAFLPGIQVTLLANDLKRFSTWNLTNLGGGKDSMPREFHRAPGLCRHEFVKAARGLNLNLEDATNLEFLASLEAAVKSAELDENVQQQLHQTVVPAITRNRALSLLSNKEKEVLKNLRENETIIITPADKGRMTGIMDKLDYVDKATALLNDTTTYCRLEDDQTKKVANEINENPKRLKDPQKLTTEEYWRMRAI